jgi:hypothetical protein
MARRTSPFLANQNKDKSCHKWRVQKQYNNQVQLEEKKWCWLPKPDFEVENSGASNFATSFYDGRENYETKMVVIGAPSSGIELVLRKILFR